MAQRSGLPPGISCYSDTDSHGPIKILYAILLANEGVVRFPRALLTDIPAEGIISLEFEGNLAVARIPDTDRLKKIVGKLIGDDLVGEIEKLVADRQKEEKGETP